LTRTANASSDETCGRRRRGGLWRRPVVGSYRDDLVGRRWGWLLGRRFGAASGGQPADQVYGLGSVWDGCRHLEGDVPSRCWRCLCGYGGGLRGCSGWERGFGRPAGPLGDEGRDPRRGGRGVEAVEAEAGHGARRDGRRAQVGGDRPRRPRPPRTG